MRSAVNTQKRLRSSPLGSQTSVSQQTPDRPPSHERVQAEASGPPGRTSKSPKPGPRGTSPSVGPHATPSPTPPFAQALKVVLKELEAYTGRFSTDEAGRAGRAKFTNAAAAIETLYKVRLDHYLEYTFSPGSRGTIKISAEGKKLLNGARREKNMQDLKAVVTFSPGKISARKIRDSQTREDAAAALLAADTPRKQQEKKLRDAVMAHPQFAITGIGKSKLVPVMDHPETNKKVLAYWNPDTALFDSFTPPPKRVFENDSETDLTDLTTEKPGRVLNLSIENPNGCSILRAR